MVDHCIGRHLHSLGIAPVDSLAHGWYGSCHDINVTNAVFDFPLISESFATIVALNFFLRTCYYTQNT